MIFFFYYKRIIGDSVHWQFFTPEQNSRIESNETCSCLRSWLLSDEPNEQHCLKYRPLAARITPGGISLELKPEDLTSRASKLSF